MNKVQLPEATHVSRVQLRTPRLARALDFYQRVIGFQVVDRGESEASLSATGRPPTLLVLTEYKHAAPRPRRATGLYHFAIRFPTRRDLAHAVLRLFAASYPTEGGSDHGMAESIHLKDPDGNGVELYADRPRDEWPTRNGELQLIMRLLDLDSLLATADEDSISAHAPARTDIGHINLHVANLAEAEEFFHDFLGLEVTARIERSATFLATGGYHHHIAVNTWGGKMHPPENSVGLISYRLAVPNSETLVNLEARARYFGYEARTADGVLQVRDPNGCWLEVEFTPKSRAAMNFNSLLTQFQHSN